MQVNGSEILVLIGALFGAGVGVALIAQLFKKIFGLNSDVVIHTMVVAISGIAAGAQYFTVLHAQLPPSILGISGPTIYGISQLVYKYATYTSNFLGKVRAYNASLKQTPTEDPTEAPVLPVAPAPATSTIAEF